MRTSTILALCVLLAAQSATADTTCRIVSGSSLVFGPYDTLSGAPTDSTATVQVRCDRVGGPQNVPVTLTLSTGSNGTGVNNRRMLQVGGLGDYLSYGLFQDVSRSSAWGFSPSVDAVTELIAVPNNGSAIGTFTIYGRIPAQQNVSPGSYADSVQITLTP